MSAAQMGRRVREYIGEHGLTFSDFARLCAVNPSTLEAAVRRGTSKNKTLVTATGYIDANPKGPSRTGTIDPLGGGQHTGSVAVQRAKDRSLLPARPAIDAAEVERRERAPAKRIAPEYRARLRDGTRAEQLATICVETPSELIATVQRAWPEQWQRVVEMAREAGTLPGAMLARVIARGLEAEA